MVVIRLARHGSKKKPFYHVVAAHKQAAPGGRYIEKLGFFNPVARGQAPKMELQWERIAYWLQVGAQPSATVKNLLDNNKAPKAA